MISLSSSVEMACVFGTKHFKQTAVYLCGNQSALIQNQFTPPEEENIF